MHPYSVHRAYIFDEWKIKQPVEESKQSGMGTCFPLIVTIPETIQWQNTWNPASLDVQSPAQTHVGRKHTNIHIQGGQS